MRNRPACAGCGDDIDLTYIVWEGRKICTHCFAEAVAEYAEDFPFLLARELNLDLVHVPED